MPKFLFEASYTPDGIKGVQSAGGSRRRDAVAQVASSVGGQLESFYFAFGERDTYVIVELPDNESAAAVAVTVNAAGGATERTVALLTPDEVDDAASDRSPTSRPEPDGRRDNQGARAPALRKRRDRRAVVGLRGSARFPPGSVPASLERWETMELVGAS